MPSGLEMASGTCPEVTVVDLFLRGHPRVCHDSALNLESWPHALTCEAVLWTLDTPHLH